MPDDFKVTGLALDDGRCDVYLTCCKLEAGDEKVITTLSAPHQSHSHQAQNVVGPQPSQRHRDITFVLYRFAIGPFQTTRHTYDLHGQPATFYQVQQWFNSSWKQQIGGVCCNQSCWNMICTPKVLRMKEGPAVFNQNAGLIVFEEPLWPSCFGFGKKKLDDWWTVVAVDRAASNNKKHFTISNQGHYHWTFYHRPLRVSAVFGQANRLKILSVSCKIDRLLEETRHLAKIGNEQANFKKTTRRFARVSDNQNPITSSTPRTIRHTIILCRISTYLPTFNL